MDLKSTSTFATKKLNKNYLLNSYNELIIYKFQDT